MDTSFFGFQSSMFWRSMSQVEVFKVRVPDVGHFIPPGETDSGNFPPASILWLQGWVSYRDFVSASSNDLFIFYLLMILVGLFFFTLCIGFTQLVSTFLFEEVVLCKTVDSLCPWEERRSGASMSWVNRTFYPFEQLPLSFSLSSPFLLLCVSVCPSFPHSLVLVLFKSFFFLYFLFWNNYILMGKSKVSREKSWIHLIYFLSVILYYITMLCCA